MCVNMHEEAGPHINDGNTHEAKQPAAFLIVLPCDTHSAFAVLGNLLLIACLHACAHVNIQVSQVDMSQLPQLLWPIFL